jgi:hypothetical protein
MTPEWAELEKRVAQLRPAGVFSTEHLTAPEPVTRYLNAAIAPGTPLAAAARLTMRGSIKIGRWLPFRARQLLAPRLGTVWEARVAGVIVGSDRYVAGSGGMNWRLLGLVPLVHAEGTDLTRSSAERAAGESIWVPTALAAQDSATWRAPDEHHISVEVDTDGHRLLVEHEVDALGQLRSSRFQRWGDPDNTKTWSPRPFGVEVTGHRTFGGATIPNRGCAGWHYGTDRWTDGEFFRFEITAYELVT